MNILRENLRENTNIKGIEISGSKFLISQLADDTTLYLHDDNSLINALTVLDNFTKISGLKLNMKKT